MGVPHARTADKISQRIFACPILAQSKQLPVAKKGAVAGVAPSFCENCPMRSPKTGRNRRVALGNVLRQRGSPEATREVHKGSACLTPAHSSSESRYRKAISRARSRAAAIILFR